MNPWTRPLVGLSLVAIGASAAPSALAYELVNPCGFCAAPTVSQGTGIVQHPEVVLIFWQDSGAQQWTNNANTPSMSQWLGYVNQIINSPYAAGINQYAGPGGYIAQPRFSAFAPIYTGPAPISGGTASGVHGIEDAINITNTEIANGNVPPPVQYTYNGSQVADDVIYAVIAPSGPVIGCSGGSCAFFGADACNTKVQDQQGRFYESVFLTQGPDDAQPTAHFGHELVEAITFWQGPVTINSSCGVATGNQIADYCECSAGQKIDAGQRTDSYYSAVDGACVVPETWGDLVWHDVPGGGWVDSYFNPKQVAGGAGGVAVVDGFDELDFFSVANGWTTFESKPFDVSELSAGGGYVALLSTDTAQSIAYGNVNTVNPTWNRFPALPQVPCSSSVFCPTPTPVTQIVMTNAYGGSIAAVDPRGYVWALVDGTWRALDLRCDHLTAYAGDLLCSTGTQRHLVYDYPASQFQTGNATWNLVVNSSYPITQIVSSSDDVYLQFGYVQAGELLMTDSYGHLYSGSEFASFSVDYNGYYGGIQMQDPLQEWWLNPSDAFQSWNESGPVGRLVSGGNAYATKCWGSYTATCVGY